MGIIHSINKSRPKLITQEIIASQYRPQSNLLLPPIQIIPHPMPIAQFLPIRRRILLSLEPLRLLI